MTVKVDLGDGVEIQWTGAYSEPERGTVGFVLEHPRGDSPTGRCGGSGWIDPGYMVGRPHWTIDKSDPLTMSPSFVCHCGFHGWIREGKWVPA